ncbi:MAG TPA: 4Fe-4S dicluster domain-containing protein [Leptospiraceae bacterium]|nr:4Fe-4S dicluster domain-containing protein [Leptospiraceae bacterium]HMW04546.1 4Fe-4S dicluster domain-containing protein [Leptospiraceae bacterium]HMX33459.1 4Fe-4S dicluster domain-containing protein [Leptospiraceae bacterium]HMY30732.1 4Fe-4S dicluster domain-containing protein [Leptospiraceae bacterium]HMZ64310.1 4Fe-4S dicluster domain-containing protein [Leptospiraceae bacterium]
MERKDFFKKGIFKAIKKAVEATEEVYDTLHESVSQKAPAEDISNIPADIEYLNRLPKLTKPKKIIHNIKFPPGAITDKERFQKTCTGCGDCIQACPYNALFPVYDSKKKKNFPHLDPNANPCLMCFDFPCINSCNYKALKPLKKDTKPKFGKAKVVADRCINHSKDELVCDVCKNVCPIENVITYQKNFLPKFSKDCTGCGICVQSCPPVVKAIIIK